MHFWHSSQALMFMILYKRVTLPGSLHQPRFTGGETKAQSHKGRCPRSLRS